MVSSSQIAAHRAEERHGGPSMRRVVALLAHPDDAEILAGGTLFKHRQRGDSVEICRVTYTPDTVRGQEGPRGPSASGPSLRAWASPIWGWPAIPRRTSSASRPSSWRAPGPGADALARRYPPRSRGQCAPGHRGARTLCGGARVGGRRRQIAGPSPRSRHVTRMALWGVAGPLTRSGILISARSGSKKSMRSLPIRARHRRTGRSSSGAITRSMAPGATGGSAEGFRRLPLAFVNNLPAYEYLP